MQPDETLNRAVVSDGAEAPRHSTIIVRDERLSEVGPDEPGTAPPCPQKLRMELVDSHELFRRGVRETLAGAFEMESVAEADDPSSALEAVRGSNPHLVIADLPLFPRGDGLEALREWLAAAPGCRVLVLSSQGSERSVAEALQAGASGFVFKDQPASELIEAVRTVLRGERYITPRFADSLVERGRRGRARGAPRSGPLGQLSTRECQVFDLVVHAFTNDGIAAHLGISAKTVETHRARINRKLGVHSTAELIRFAALNGLVGPAPTPEPQVRATQRP